MEWNAIAAIGTVAATLIMGGGAFAAIFHRAGQIDSRLESQASWLASIDKKVDTVCGSLESHAKECDVDRGRKGEILKDHNRRLQNGGL